MTHLLAMACLLAPLLFEAGPMMAGQDAEINPVADSRFASHRSSRCRVSGAGAEPFAGRFEQSASFGGILYLFNSSGHPWRTSGPDIEHLGDRVSADLGSQNNKMSLWIEATWKDEDGTLYGAYHYEPDTVCFSNSHILTAPRIGWVRSTDNGAKWEDLGFIISASLAVSTA
jgi:hypothetical protein